MSSRLIAGSLFSALFLSFASPARAIVTDAGDVSPKRVTDPADDPFGQGYIYVLPNLPNIGGPVVNTDPNDTDDVELIVGGTGSFSGNLTLNIGTTVGEVTINNPSGTLPLIAPEVTIGKVRSGIGRININDFGSTLFVERDGASTGILVVGEDGQGQLRLTNGARVYVGEFDDPNSLDPQYVNGETFIGRNRGSSFVSQGVVIIDGFGSIMETEELTVAEFGVGTVEVTALGNLMTTNAVMGQEFGSIGRTLVSGLGTRWRNRNNLIVGVNGSAILDLRLNGLVTSGSMTIGSLGVVEMAGGRIALDSPNNSILNNGVIRGDGRIENGVFNAVNGEFRNAAGLSALREKIVVTGDFENDGLVESLGGEMEFDGLFNNNASGDIIARDAVLRFDGNINNDGEIAYGGETTIYTNSLFNNGNILVLPDSEAVIRGNVVLAPSSLLSLTVGPLAGTLNILGDATLDGFLALDYAGNPASNPGDTYTVLTASDGFGGTTFTNTQAAADGRLWSINYGTNDITVTALGIAPMPVGADFDGDGFVTGADLDIWEDNYGAMGPIGSLDSLGDANGDGSVDGLDFLRIQIDFGGPPTPLMAVATAVPEPGTLVLALSALAFYRRRR